jgi:YidC/Oxa1 family membrane protein insertase
MDTKRLITMMLISFAVIFGWQIFIKRLFESHPEWKRPGQASTAPTTTPAPAKPPVLAGGPTTSSSTAPTTSTTQSTPAMAQATTRVVSAATQPSVATIGVDAAYPMVVKISSTGAGLESVTLKQFRAPGGKGDYIFQTPYPEDATTRALATRSITVNGNEIPLASQNWTLEKQDSASATFIIDLGAIKVRKTFELEESFPKKPRYDLRVSYALENISGTAVAVQVAYNGTTTPPHENEQGHDVSIIAGYDAGYEKVKIVHQLVDEYSEKKPVHDLIPGPDNVPLLWAGTSSVYFNAVVRPEPLEANSVVPKYVTKLTGAALNPASDALNRHVALVFQTSDLTIEPGKQQMLPATVYLGPRWRAVLNNEPYAAFPLHYDESLVMTSGPCGYCTFQWLINGLVKLLQLFHFVFRDWGLAIIALVVLVRSLLHPVTKRSQVSMMKMGKLGPEMERLKKKHGDNKDELNKQMMAMYKDQGVGAYLGCLPMFLQMPIWIALWSALNSTFELRQAPFLWGYTWIHDLARPDRLIEFGSSINLPFGMHISAFNLLPLLLAVVFFLQQKFTPKPPASTPEQAQQQKMMQWMSLLFPVFLYNGPSGLNLYILTSTTIGIIESKRIRDHIKQKEEEEKAGKIIVDASIKKRHDDDDDRGSGVKRTGGPQTPKTGLGGWLQKIQQQAEDIRKQADKGRK